MPHHPRTPGAAGRGPRPAMAVLCALLAALAPAAGAGEVSVGVCLPLTGGLSMYGQSALVGVITRVDEWNRAGRAPTVHLVVRDNRSDLDVVVQQTAELARDPKVPVIIGPLFSEALDAVAAVAARNKTVVATPLICTPAADDDPPWVFRLATAAADQAQAMALFQAVNFGARRAAVLVDPRYSISGVLADDFGRAFRAQGGEVAVVAEFKPATMTGPGLRRAGGPSADDVDYTVDVPCDYTGALDRIAAAKPEILYIPCYAPQIVQVVQAIAARSDLAGVRLCGPDLWDNQWVLDGAGRRLLRACFTSSLYEEGLAYPAFQRFLAAMREAGIDQPDAQTACAYDATTLVLEALEQGTTGAEARDALLTIDRQWFATGRTTINARGEAHKQVMIRMVEEREGWLVGVYAERYQNLPPLPGPGATSPAAAPANGDDTGGEMAEAPAESDGEQ